MNSITISKGLLKGTLDLPPSKSIAHRAIICAAGANGTSTISNIELSDDIKATLSAVQAIGAKAKLSGTTLEIEGVKPGRRKKSIAIDCGESGSTLRFFIPLSLVFAHSCVFKCGGRLLSRPLQPYFEILKNICYINDGHELWIKGKLNGGEFNIAGDISSQFVTGLLISLPLIKGNSVIHLTSPLESKSYVDLTAKVLSDFGIEIDTKDNEFIIRGGQNYAPGEYKIEQDYSQAAFFFAANALGSKVCMPGMNSQSLQGDSVAEQLMRQIMTGQKRTIDGSQIPDLIPAIALLAALSDGVTQIVSSGRLRFKESDRLDAIASELNKLGTDITQTPDGLIIRGKNTLEGGCEAHSHNDHRIAMKLAVAATVCNKPVAINNHKCVAKSYPGFFEDFIKLGGNVI